MLFCSLEEHEEITFTHKFMFVFAPYLIGVISSKECQKWGVQKKNEVGARGSWLVKPSAHYGTSTQNRFQNPAKHLRRSFSENS